MAAKLLAEEKAGALSGIYAEIRLRLGTPVVPNIFKAMAAVSSDVLTQNWVVFRRTVLEGDVPRTLKEMIGLVLAHENGSRYALALYTDGLARLGVSRQVIGSLGETGDAEELSGGTRAVLQFAKAYNLDPDGADMSPLEAAGFTEEKVQEIIDTILVAEGINRFAEESDLPADIF